jgi:hypothetical protein
LGTRHEGRGMRIVRNNTPSVWLLLTILIPST